MTKTIESLASFFGKESFLRLSVTATLVLYGINLAAKLLCSQYALFIADAIFFLCVAFLYAAYRSHNKNVQKGLLGAVLMWYLYDEISYVLQNIVFDSEGTAAYSSACGEFYVWLSVITLFLYAELFINHFVINSDHHSRPVNVCFNQLLVMAIAAISVISMVLQMIMFFGQGAQMLEAASWHLGLAALMAMIAAYETRFDAYRIARENKADAAE